MAQIAHRPEEILEVDALIEDAAVRMADTLSASLPHIDRQALYEFARAEFECAADDLGQLVFSQFGSVDA